MMSPEEEVLKELMAEMGAMDGQRAMKHKGRMPMISIEIETEGKEGEEDEMGKMGKMSDDELGEYSGFNPAMVRKMMAKKAAVR